jgi:monoamine oxidase
MVDVVIVGGGAAGIGAGKELASRGISYTILEASDRIGGRAFTDKASLPGHWDQGCQWFHCADVNPLVAEAEKLGWGFEREDRGDKVMAFIGGRWQSPEELAALRASLNTAFATVYDAAKAGRDLPITQVLPESGKWQSYVRNFFQLMISEDPERTSALGYGDYDDSEVNWVVTGGLGGLIERLGEGLPIRTGVAVRAIDEQSGGVRLETSGGPIEAKAAIVTASTNVLLSGAIRIGPGPAKDLVDLMQDLPCGSYEKIAFAFDRLPIDQPDILFCHTEPAKDAMPLGFQVVGGPQPKIIGHVGGSDARDLVAAGRDAMIAFGRDALVAAFGGDVTRAIKAAEVTGWQTNPWIRGAYSYARVGGGKSRKAMIGAETGAIRFAGEAFSLRWHSTVHGAWQSGRDVASGLAVALAAGKP